MRRSERTGREAPWTKRLWVYDLRTDMHFTLRQNPLKREHLDELIERDRASLDLFWIRDEALEETANLPEPDVIAREIVEDLGAALEA